MTGLPLKFLLLPTTQLVAIAGLLLGDGYTFLGIGVFACLALLLDVLEDRSDVDELEELGWRGRALVYTVFGLQAVVAVTGLHAATSAAGWVGVVGATLTTGQLLGMGGINVGHELAHGGSALERELSRVVVVPCLHTASVIDHVHSHHRHIGTESDATTARRDETLLTFAVRSIRGQNAWAWQFEAERARRNGRAVRGLSNRALRGHLMEAGYLVLVWAVYGWQGLAVAIAAAVIALRAIESMFYIAHFGLVRVPGTPCAPRHSWNSRRVISSGYMLNLTHHSHHHAAPALPYWSLRVHEDAPVLPMGPGVLSVLAAVPWLWFRIMDPALKDWDLRFATEDERALVAGSSCVPLRRSA